MLPIAFGNCSCPVKIGDPKVLQAVLRWSQITEDFRNALAENDYDTMHSLINENFDLRRKTIKISQGNIEMVELARTAGASAKFTGSGGAIIGTYKNEKMFEELSATLGENNIDTLKPSIVTS